MVVGSGLILLVIVGAWLAVLVPMALRSHDTTSALTSVDRFSDAMRVLSRRESAAADRRSFVVPRAPALPLAAAPVSLAVRRRRTLFGLLAAAVLMLLGSLVAGPLLYVHLLLDGLVVAFVVHCRRQAQLRQARQVRQARRARQQERKVAVSAPRRTSPAHVVGIPAQMPARPAPLTAALPAPAARHDEPVPAAAIGSAWSPVPVPVPTYVTKPMAPPRRPRVLDLTKPGEWTAALEADDVGLDILDDEAAELEGILERRRAVND